MNISLYHAAEQVRELLEKMDPETGEMPEGFEAARSVVERKGAAVAAYVLETERVAEMLAEHAKHFAALAKAAEKKSDRLRVYLRENMAALGITSMTDERNQFTVKLERERDESVDLFDVAQLPIDYLREVPATTEPDKRLIKKALTDGFDVPGARIVKADRLTIK